MNNLSFDELTQFAEVETTLEMLETISGGTKGDDAELATKEAKVELE